MKRFLIAAAMATASLCTPALANDVGVSVSIGQPGFYGRLDIGGFPPPLLLYPQPVMVHRVPVSRPPLYLHVPPGHAKNWRKHCHTYHACGERVYFVRDIWYRHEYAPRYQERHGHRHDHRGYRDGYRDGHRGDSRDDDWGSGQGKKHGHGHDHGHGH